MLPRDLVAPGVCGSAGALPSQDGGLWIQTTLQGNWDQKLPRPLERCPILGESQGKGHCKSWCSDKPFSQILKDKGPQNYKAINLG